MHKSTITIDVSLDEQKIPENISWSAQDSTADNAQKAKAMMVSFWDGMDKAALRIDLWTKEMMVDEMADFYYQTLMGMADNFQRSTGQTEIVNDMKAFASNFYKKFQANQLRNNKA
jgi:gliding motility-associated protein GldC